MQLNIMEGSKAEPKAIYDYFTGTVAKDQRYNASVQNLVVIFLEKSGKITGHKVVTSGLEDKLLFSTKEIFKAALEAKASLISVAHNHTNGDSEPDDDDYPQSRQILEAGDALDIEVDDMLVISTGEKPYYSMRELACRNARETSSKLGNTIGSMKAMQELKIAVIEAVGGKDQLEEIIKSQQAGEPVDPEVAAKVAQAMKGVMKKYAPPGTTVKFGGFMSAEEDKKQTEEKGGTIISGGNIKEVGKVKMPNFEMPGGEFGRN